MSGCLFNFFFFHYFTDSDNIFLSLCTTPRDESSITLLPAGPPVPSNRRSLLLRYRRKCPRLRRVPGRLLQSDYVAQRRRHTVPTRSRSIVLQSGWYLYVINYETIYNQITANIVIVCTANVITTADVILISYYYRAFFRSRNIAPCFIHTANGKRTKNTADLYVFIGRFHETKL